MASHTPGPWHVSQDTNVDAGDVHTDGVRVAKCWTSTFAPPPLEAAANARLIAAAPDLLEACKTIVQLGKSRYHDLGIDKMVEAAIAKAEDTNGPQ